MNALRRGGRNVWRAPGRSALIIVVLGASVGVFLTLAQAAQSIAQRTRGLAGAYQNLIEVRGAGATGMGAGADALAEEYFDPATKVAGVKDIDPYVYQRTFDQSQPVPISIFVGMRPQDEMRVASHGEVGDPNIVGGRRLRPGDEGRAVAVVGTVYAEQYGVTVGDTLTLSPARVLLTDRPDPDVSIDPLDLEVVGIFDADFAFGNAQVFLPLDIAQDGFAQGQNITHIFVTATSADRVDEVEEGLREVFGDRADVISGQATAAQFASTLGTIRSNSVIGAGVALVVAALIIGFAMALVAAERRTEVGVLKALGASRAELVRQFVAEATALALLGAVAGFGLFWAFGAQLGRALLGRAAASIPNMTAVGDESPLRALGIELGASTATVALTLGAVVLLAAAGNLIPLTRSVNLEPAEAMRHE